MARRRKKNEYKISDIIKGGSKAGVNHAKIGGNSKPKVTHVNLQKNIKQGVKNTQNHHVTRTDIRNSSSHYDRSVTGNTFRTNRGINRIGNATSGAVKDWTSSQMLTGSHLHSNVNAGRIRRENYSRYRDQRGSNDRRFVNTTSRQENRIKTDIVKNKNKIDSEIKSTQKAADIGSARTEKQAFSLQKSAQKDLNKSKKGAGKVGSFLIDAYTNAMEMGLDLLAGGGITALPSMATRSYGGAYMQAINDQKNVNGKVTKQAKSNAAKYALGEAVLQTATEKMFAPFKPLTKMSGKGVFGSLGESIEKKTLNTNAVKGLISKGMSEKTAGRIVKGLVGTTEEGLEEVAADIPEPLLQSKTYDKDAKKQYKQGSYYAGMARDFALGAGTAALLGGANAAIEGGNKLAKSGNSFSKGTKDSILESAKKSSNEDVKAQYKAVSANKQATDKDYRNLANSMTLEEATKQPEDTEAYQRATQIQKQKAKGYRITDYDYSDLANKVYSSKKQISERQDNAIREATAQLAGDTSKMNRAAKVTTSDAPVVMNLTASAVNEESENAEAVLRSIMPDVDTANSPQLAELPDAIGRIQVGTATVQDYSTIMGSNEGKALFTAVSGQNLPATNSGAVNILTQYTARQRVMNSPQIIMQAKNIVKNNTASAMTQGLSEDESKAYMAGLNNIDTDQIDNYNEAFLKYFNGGFVKGRSGNKENGFSMDTISKNISPEIRKSIGEVNAKTFYEAGIKRGTEQTEKANKSSSKVKKTAETKSGTLKASNLSKRRLGEEAVSYIESIASITGTNIEIKETTKDSKNINGYFKGNDTIVLYDGADNPLGQVIKHELTHYIKKHAPKEYEAYQSFIIDNYYKYSPDALSKRVNGLISLYNQNGVKLTYEDALEELCADATDVFFKDSDMIERICRENRTLAEKIYDGIKSLLTALKKLGQESKTNYGGFLKTVDALDDAERLWTKALAATADTEVFDNGNEVVQYSIRQEDPPKKTIKAYKVFVAKEGKLYPPMVANPEGADTPVGVWLNADVGKEVTPTKTGRRQVKAGGKGTQGGSGSLSYRPGWHLGAYPMAKQFARLNPKTGKKELFPENFVWAECEIAADKNYQNEAHENGMTKNGKFNHAYAGLQHIPEDGYYEYRTNPDPTTKPWYITGAMKVVKILDDAETNKILSSAGEPIQHRKGGSKTLKDLGLDDVQNKLSNKKKLSLSEQQYNIIKNSNPLSERFNENSDDIRYSISTKDSQGKKLSNAQREFFKDSKAVDKDGNLAVVYHGTAKGDFTTFDPKFSDDGISIFMSDNKGIALSYAGSSDPISESNKGRGIYSCYLNLKNPMTVDCRGANWNKILDPDYDSVLFEYKDTKDGKRNYLVSDNGGNGKLLSEDEIESKYGDKVSEELHHEELTNKSFKRMNKTITVYTKGGNVFYPKWNDDAPIMKTRDICKRAYDNGNDGVIFSNVYDTGKYSSGTSKSTIYAAFSPEQIKNTDNTKPTGSDDIRFSISEKDSTGETLTEDQRKYFAQSKAVDRQGNLEVLYHGTSEGGFTVFDPMMSDDETSLFFTDDEDVAATYSDSWDLYDSTEDNEGEAMNYPVYLNLKNPLIMNGNGYASWNNIAIKGFERLIFESEDGEDYSILSSNTGEEYDDKKTIERKFGKDTLKVIEEKNNGVLLLKDGKLVEDESMDAGNVSVYDGKMVAGTTRYWAKYAKEHGYDGVIFNNIADEGLYGDGITYRTSNIYIAFNSNQVKDVSNEHPTENEDIRYQFSNKAPGNNPALAVERKRNKRMEKEISRLKSEFKRSKNVTPDDKDTNKAISNLIETWKGKVSRKVHAEIKKDVVQIYRELNQQNPGWSAIEEFCCDAADLIINESEILKNSDAYSLRKDVIKDLRRIGTITVDPIHDHELGDGWNAMRKSFFGIVNLTHEKGHGSLDTQWQEWAGARPDIFPADATEGDQIKILDEILKSGKPDYRGIESAEFTDDELFDKVAEDVLRMSFGLKQHKTFADRKAEDKQAALEKQKKRMDDRYNKMVEKNRKNMADKDREYREKIKDVRSRYKDKKDRKYYTERIKSYANWMSGRLLQPTEGKYIPEGYRKAVARLLSSFDFETDRTTKNAEKNGLSKRMIHVIDLITQYQNIMDNDESMMQVSDDFQDKLNKLAVLENKRVADLTTEELADVYHVVKDIATHLSNMNKAFADGVKEQISELGDAVIAESRDTKDRSNASGIIPAGIDFITTSNNNPIDEFVCIGGTMEKLYMNIRKGFDKYIHNAEKIKEFTSTLQNEYKDIKNWSGDRAKAKTFKMQDGKTIQLTTAQVMSLYCLSKRPQALTHLMGSGIVSASVLNIKGKAGGRAFKSLYASRTSESRVMPTTMDINNILKGLTPDQIKVADYLQDYMVRVSAKLGNETSKKLYDIKKFNDPNYFPIKSSDKYLEEKFDNKQPSKIKNVGFTKETVKNASNPIVIDDIFNVFTNHTSTMAQYNALVPALTDFERVFNYKQRDKNGKTIASVRERLDAAYGRKTTDYITKFINDVNKNYNRDSDHELFNKVFANTKKGTLGFSLRVAIQQPTAIFRAGAVINPKYLMDVRNTAINLKEMREHSPIALWKSWGFYNTDVSSKMSDIFMNRRNAGDKLFMGIYGTLDDITWGYIWNATKAEIKQTRPELEKGSKAYWNAVNDRFSYIVDRTQVVDSVFHRSQIMRKTDMFSKLITAYMAEPTKTYNMLKTELTLASKDIKAGNKADATKRISRVTSVFFANAIAVSVAAALIDVLRSTLWDDDDNDDKDFLERWLKYSEQNTLQNINPLSFIPGLRDVQSIFQGYDANRADLEVIIQLKTAIDTWSSDTASTFKKIKVTAKAISLATGIPVSNIIREGESAYFEAVSAISGSPTKAKYMMHKLEYNYKSDTGESKLVKDYKTALKQGDTTAIKYIKKDLTDNVGVKPERLSNVVKNIYSDRLKAAIATYDADKVLKLIATEKAHGADTSKMLDTIVYKTTEDYKKTYDLENDDPKTRTKIDNFLRGIGYSKSYVKARKERYDRGWARYQVYMVYKHYGYNKAYAEAAYYCRKYPGIYKDARTMMYGQKRLGDSTKAGYLKGKWEAK